MRQPRKKEENGCAQGEPGKDPDVKKLGIHHVKNEGQAKTKVPGAPVEDDKRNEKIEEQATITERVNHPFLMKKAADDREIGSFPQPDAHRFAAQPVRVNLGDATHEINHAHLDA